MNGYQQRAGLAIAGLAVSVVGVGAMVRPAHAAQTEITNLQLAPTSNGVQLTLQVQGNMRPPVFSVNRGNSSIVDISNAQLRLPNGSDFTQPSPVEGIGVVQVLQLNPDTVRVIVEGNGAAPIADVTRRDSAQGLMVMNFDRASSIAGTSTGIPAAGGQPAPTGQYPSAVPPFIPRASAPPVGDIAVGAVDVDPERIELGSAQIIPKLLLRDAPVREVLTLLGRSSGVNVAYAEGEGDAGGPTISLDIENESVDDVFNYVIRLAGLQANRVGQTVFVGKTLPGDAQNRIVRTIRLNQMRATATTTYETSIETQADTGGSVNNNEGGSTTAQTGINRNVSVSDQVEGTGAKEILESYGANGGGEGDGGRSTLLEGLEVVADSRTNSLTLIGNPRKVDIASQLLTQLDVRRRQVAVNIKFIDVNLLNQKFSDADLQFKFDNNLGIGLIPGKPGAPGEAFGAIFGTAVNPTNVVTNLTTTFLGKLFAEITNENAKVLTNPTLIVQEGSSAQVNLTTQIFSGFETSRSTSASASGAETQATTRKPIIQNAGVIMNVNIDRIDDNGFVTLSLAPEVSQVGPESFDDQGTVAKLLQQRRLETGVLRLRDGQTLVLAGIIRDEDRVTLSKIPLLGDIPLLGRLFRDETKRRERSELVVLVTPQILDDSDQASFGYQYRPSPEVEPLLRQP